MNANAKVGFTSLLERTIAPVKQGFGTVHIQCRLSVIVAALLVTEVECSTCIAQGSAQDSRSSQPPIVVTEFFPADYLTDGTVRYQASIQRAMDKAAETSRTLVFPPLIYRAIPTIRIAGTLRQVSMAC